MQKQLSVIGLQLSSNVYQGDETVQFSRYAGGTQC